MRSERGRGGGLWAAAKKWAALGAGYRWNEVGGGQTLTKRGKAYWYGHLQIFCTIMSNGGGGPQI